MFQYVTMDSVGARATLVPWRCHAGMLTGKLSCAGSKRFGDSAGLPRHTDSQALTVEFVDDKKHPERPAIAGGQRRSPSVAQRRLVHPPAAGEAPPCLVYIGEYSDGSRREIEVASVAQFGSRSLLRNSAIKLHLQQWNRRDRRARNSVTEFEFNQAWLAES